MLNNTALIDGDWLVYAVVTSPNMLHEHYHAELDEWSYKLCVDEAAEEVLARAQDFQTHAEAQDFVLCFGGKQNFRKELRPSYKANRRGTRKPLGYRSVIERLNDKALCAWSDGYEGDDVMGMLSHRGQGNVVVSVDKDMKTVPCRMWNPMHPELGIVTVTPEQARHNVALQTLTGDSTDGYQGCPGLGPKKAEKVLAGVEPGQYWATVVNEYAKKGLALQEAQVVAKLAQIVYTGDAKIEFSMPPVPKQYEAELNGAEALSKFMGA